MVEPLRHRQTKGAATAMFYLMPPRHISTLPIAPFCQFSGCFRSSPISGPFQGPPACLKRATFGSRRAHSIISSERTNEVGRLPIDYRSRSLLVCDTA